MIILNNVFEHLESPMAVLSQLTAALRPGGVMFLQTLSSQSLTLWAQGGNWYYFDAGHLYVPSHVSMKHYFRRNALTVLRSSTHGYRSGSASKTGQRSYLRRRCDKWLANVASLSYTGTRVQYLLQREVVG